MFSIRSTVTLCTTALLLGACNPVTPTPSQGLTLRGKLLGPGIRVTIEGLPSVSTDAQGNFSIPGAKLPYTVSVALPDLKFEGRTVQFILEDVSSGDLGSLLTPWLTSYRKIFSNTPQPSSSAKLKGVLSQTVPFQDINLYITSTESSVSRGYQVQPKSPFSTDYELPLSAFSDPRPSGKGTLYAFQSSGNYTDLIQNYTAYGKRSLSSIPETGTLESQDVVLKKITTATLDIKPTFPAGVSDSSAYVQTYYQGEPGEGVLGLGRGVIEAEGKVSLPVTGEGSYLISVGAGGTSSLVRLTGLPATLSVTLPNRISFTKPARGASVRADQTSILSWSGEPGTFFVTLNKVNQDQTASQDLLQAIVPKNELDLKRFGVALEPSSSYYVNVNRVGGVPYSEGVKLITGALTTGTLSGDFARVEVSHYDGPFSTLP